MPGIPTGRACDACRKQKKKCDESQPTCSRCQRLNILCVGSGAKRYRWFIQTASGSADTSTAVVRTASSTLRSDPSLTQHISRGPSNAQTVLIMTLIDKVHLAQDSDLRYNLTWAYGPFIQEVPRRLGKNAALDAAATSLALSHVRYSTGRRDAAPEEIKAYGNALSTLRVCLDDPTVAREANTLCAVMLLLLSQQLIGFHGRKYTGHGEGAAIILKAKGLRYDPDDEFEDLLLKSLRGPLLFEALFNPRIKFTDEEWTLLITRHSPKTPNTDILRMIASWAAFPKLTAVVRQAWESETRKPTKDILDHIKYSRELYDTSILILDRLRLVYVQSTEELNNAKNEDSANQARYMYAFNQRLCMMAVFTSCYINCLLRAMIPEDDCASLRTEAVDYAQEIVSLAHQAMQFRPLGSAFATICLALAWLSPVDGDTRGELLYLWNQYRFDFPSTRQLELDASDESQFWPAAMRRALMSATKSCVVQDDQPSV